MIGKDFGKMTVEKVHLFNQVLNGLGKMHPKELKCKKDTQWAMFFLWDLIKYWLDSDPIEKISSQYISFLIQQRMF